jgi:hypothetical protein
MLTQSDLKCLFYYDETTGIFTRAKDHQRSKKGSVVGTPNYKGYLLFAVKGKTYRAHRLAWLYVYGKFPSMDLDHINGNRSDNRIENLRELPNKFNQQNRRKPNPNNTSGYKGVGWSKQLNKWRVKIVANYKTIHLGYFHDIDDAVNAYALGAAKYHNFNPSAKELP